MPTAKDDEWPTGVKLEAFAPIDRVASVHLLYVFPHVLSSHSKSVVGYSHVKNQQSRREDNW